MEIYTILYFFPINLSRKLDKKDKRLGPSRILNPVSRNLGSDRLTHCATSPLKSDLEMFTVFGIYQAPRS